MIEKELVAGENDKATRSISIIREHLHDPKFKEEHRTKPKFFTRNYKITFISLILLILRKSAKSAQLVLNEFFKDLGNGVLATGSAFTKARRHLRYQAFIALNQKAIIHDYRLNLKKVKLNAREFDSLFQFLYSNDENLAS